MSEPKFAQQARNFTYFVHLSSIRIGLLVGYESIFISDLTIFLSIYIVLW